MKTNTSKAGVNLLVYIAREAMKSSGHSFTRSGGARPAARNPQLLDANAPFGVRRSTLRFSSFRNGTLYPVRTAIILQMWFCGLAVFGLAGVLSPAAAQWTIDDANFAGRYQNWENAPDDGFAPGRAIGASSLAFGPDGALYMACEKFPFLLVFSKDGSKPRRVRLEGVLHSKGQPDVDLETMSIYDNNVYLFDEDNLVIYLTPADRSGRVTKLDLVFVGSNKIDNASTTDNPSDHSSVEGMVVTDSFLGPKAYGSKLGAGPYFYLLDERDNVAGRKEAKLYLGVRKGDQINVAENAIAFDLPDEPGFKEGFRLSELFEYQGALYSLKTRRPQGRNHGVYKVVRCDLESRQLKEICDFSNFANDLKNKGYDNNFEGAAVASDGRLFLTSDNESSPTGGAGPPPMKDDWRGKTPIISLRLQP